MANNARAHILIECSGGKTNEVVSRLHSLDGVKSVERVLGPYEVIAVVEAPSLSEIGSLVTQNIHPITGIMGTVTCLVV
jgi:DNA-binding Lrp family transcriptional regulator